MIELRDVAFSDLSMGDQPEAVFAQLSLSIPPGRYVALMEPKGSGKSSLGNLIKGLLSPFTGQVLLDGRALKFGEISPRVGYVFSNPGNQIVSAHLTTHTFHSMVFIRAFILSAVTLKRANFLTP